MTDMLYILIVSGIAVILAFFVDWGHKDELELNSNIVGFGKAKGLYIIKMENSYVVAGIKVKSKRKAVKEFMKLVEENSFLPPGMYFKTFVTEPVKPAAPAVKITLKQNINPAPAQRSAGRETYEQRSPLISPEAAVKPETRWELKQNNGLKPKPKRR
jgi:hypothetical protein